MNGKGDLEKFDSGASAADLDDTTKQPISVEEKILRLKTNSFSP